ncbi:hypothetical protein [Solirubrum puertoriconensis]|uniref:hypothetical protein n=1 Tax=Solirubrum puertoriconensis TaxID=1751427 RepID=UPI00122DEB99|nr:hypothetical protein [Solirubrum puertoriconensis]
MCVNSYIYQKEKIKNSNVVAAKIIWSGKPSGIRVGPDQIGCSYRLKGTLYERSFEKRSIKVSSNSCVELKYSVDDPSVAELNYDKGSFTCPLPND